MTSWKLKASCVAIASASLILAGCGDDSSNDSGLGVLKYTGSETEATVTTENTDDIATQTAAVVLNLAANDAIGGAAWNGIYGSMYYSSAQIADAVNQAQAAVRAASKTGTSTSTPAGIVVTQSSGNTQYENGSVMGECGGTATYNRTRTYKYTDTYETDEEATPVDENTNEYGEDSTYTFNNFCFEFGEDATEVVISGSMTENSNGTYGEDYENDARTEAGKYEQNTNASVVIAENTFKFNAVYEGEYSTERAYNEELGEDLYNPDTYKNKWYGTYVVTGTGVSAKGSSEGSCHVTEDLTSTDCDYNDVIAVGGKNYKYDGYADVSGSYVYGSINELFLPQYGSVSASYNSLMLCDDYTGFASGSISINDGAIVISFNGCGNEPTITPADSEVPMPE